VAGWMRSSSPRAPEFFSQFRHSSISADRTLVAFHNHCDNLISKSIQKRMFLDSMHEEPRL
jgi:hypothetical protein